MGWVPGWPRDPTDPKGDLDPHALVLHRTYGRWPGDYAVGKQGIFQFLIGADVGRYVQFMSSTSVAYHCNGANFRAVGCELEGSNEEPLTDWQIQKLGELLRYVHSEHGIPLTYQDPLATPPASISVNHSNFTGIIAHRSVMTDDGSSQHTDYVTVEDFNKALGGETGDEFTVGQMDDIAQWEKDTRKLINEHTDDQIDHKVGQWMKDVEARVNAHTDQKIADLATALGVALP